MGVLFIQNDFSHGELDRRFFSRSDQALYTKGAQQLRNVVVIPQGGARRRFGSKFIKTITNVTGAYMLTEFQFSLDVNYLFLLEPGRLTMFRDDEQKFTVTAGIPWSTEDLKNRNIRFAQTANLMIVSGSFAPIQIQRGNTDANWDIRDIVFRNNPTIPFETDYSNIIFTLASVEIKRGVELTTDVDFFTSEFVGGRFEAVGPTESLGRIGVARITALVGTKTVTVDILSEFAEALKTSGMLGSNVVVEVPTFNAQRGWPFASAFYEGRLWFGGTVGGVLFDSGLTQNLFASVVDDFFNFDVGTGQFDDSIQIKIQSKKTNIIQFLVADRSLQIFTDSTEFAAPQDDAAPLTPGGTSIRKQSGEGIENVLPVVLDNQTFYAKRGGKGINSFIYTNDKVSYQSNNISVLSPSLIRNPIDAAVIKGSSTDDANYLLYVNGDDGTLAVFQSLAIENVAAWTLSTLEDDTAEAKFHRITEVGDTIYAVIERVDATLSWTTEVADLPWLTEDGEEWLTEETSVHELIKLSFDRFTDSSILQSFTTPTTVITGLDHLDDKTVHIRGEVIADQGFFVFPAQVVQNGQITLETGVVTVEVGLPFTPIIQPLPVQIASNEGSTLYIPKRLTRFFIDFYESTGIFLDGTLIPYLQFGSEVLDQPPQIKTELIEFKNMGGWDRRQAPILTQPDPLPMTILGIGYEVEI